MRCIVEDNMCIGASNTEGIQRCSTQAVGWPWSDFKWELDACERDQVIPQRNRTNLYLQKLFVNPWVDLLEICVRRYDAALED